MIELLKVAPCEYGTVRLFSVEMDAEDRQRILNPKSDTAPTGAALGALLGIDWIDPQHADLFDVAELDDLGLLGFLTQGAGIAREDLEADATRLSALEGTILIVYARGFTEAKTLTPLPNVSALAVYTEAGSTVQFEPLPSAAAQGNIGTNRPAPANPHMNVLIAILALPIVALILGAILWAVLR